jgi:hypothetical protein
MVKTFLRSSRHQCLSAALGRERYEDVTSSNGSYAVPRAPTYLKHYNILLNTIVLNILPVLKSSQCRAMALFRRRRSSLSSARQIQQRRHRRRVCQRGGTGLRQYQQLATSEFLHGLHRYGTRHFRALALLSETQ